MTQNGLTVQELNNFRIEISNKYIKIFPLLLNFKTQILIEKKSGKTLLADKNIVYHEENKEIETKMASLILGVIVVENQRVLVYAKSVYYQGQMTQGLKIYQIAQVEFVPFGPLIGQGRQVLQIMQKQVLSFSFYFSLERDLTLSCQDFYSESTKRPRSRYFWNYEMLRHMISSESNKQGPESEQVYKSQWCIPIIQGHYGSFSYFMREKFEIQVHLISRRSKHRSGTRFYNRGIDENGCCANFVETEIVLLIGNTLISTRQSILQFVGNFHQQRRYYSGSVPLYWQQISQLSKIKLTRDRDFTSISVRKHLKQLVKQNEHILLINLLQKKKQNEYLLIKQYEHHIQSLDKQVLIKEKRQLQTAVKYAYWDLNYYDKLQQYEKTWQFVESFMEITDTFKSFQINMKTNTIYSIQQGAYRVSCLDCLARTNRFLMLLSLQSLYINLEKVNSFKQSFKQLAIQLLSNTDQELSPFLRYYKNLWQQKGQFQSIIYSGSPSTQGKKTKLLDMIENTFISLQRYYNQKFIDQIKQLSLDIMLYHKNYQPLQRLKHKLPFTVSVLTWNVNALSPQKLPAQTLSQMFKPLEKSDLIVIGLQEMIELNTNNVMNDNTQESVKSEKWKEVIQQCLNSKGLLSGEYVFVQKLQMVGLFMIMYINKKWAHTLRSVHKDIVKTGMKIGVSEKYGNKGGIVIRISILQTSLTFICSHLAAHQSRVKQRVNDLQQIHKKSFQQNKQSIQNELQIDFSDYKFFFGDMNFRINGEFNQIKEMIEGYLDKEELANKGSGKEKQELNKERLFVCEKLMQRDQLFLLMNTDTYQSTLLQSQDPSVDYFKLYRQPDINFFPTYKLNKHTGQYSLQKNRIPSYCDRILYWKNYEFDELNVDEEIYTDLLVKGSDHRPVYGRFVVNILKQTRKNSQSIILEESYVQQSSQQDLQFHPQNLNNLI